MDIKRRSHYFKYLTGTKSGLAYVKTQSKITLIFLDANSMSMLYVDEFRISVYDECPICLIN